MEILKKNLLKITLNIFTKEYKVKTFGKTFLHSFLSFFVKQIIYILLNSDKFNPYPANTDCD